jgi:hypothetical protein
MAQNSNLKPHKKTNLYLHHIMDNYDKKKESVEIVRMGKESST